MNIGEKIKSIRTEKMMTQAELAGSQVTRNMLSMIEKGKAVPSIPTLNYLAEKLKVSPGFLLADEAEEFTFRKTEDMADIRLSYGAQNYRICFDLCRKMENRHGRDDEIALIMAECALGIAREELFADQVRSACEWFDTAAMYSKETSYRARHVYAAAWLYLKYLDRLSPSLVSEIPEEEWCREGGYKYLPYEDAFCRYMIAIERLQNSECSFPLFEKGATSGEMPLLDKHIEGLRLMKAAKFEKAAECFGEILRSGDPVPGTVLYSVFGDMEACCRKLGNQKDAKLYADTKAAEFERLLF